MKYRSIVLLLGLLLTLAACGTENAVSSAAEPAPEPETFGAETVDSAPAQMAETTTAPEAVPAEPETGEATPAPAVNLDDQVLLSLLLTDCVDGLSYDPMSSGCFWRAVGYLMVQGGGTIQDGRVTMTEAELEPLVTALFGLYEGQWPGLTEEDPMVTSEYVDGEPIYTATAAGLFDHTVHRGEPELQADGTYRCQAELTLGEEVLGTYTVTLADYPAADGRFAYCVTGLEPA